MKNRIIAVFMTCCMLLSFFSFNAFAAQQEPILPRWTNTSVVSASLNFVGTTGNVDVSITGKTGVTNITAEIKLYYKTAAGTWDEYPQGWTYNVDQQVLVVNETFTGLRGCEYKIELEATVTKDGYGEVITKTATDTCPTSP